MANESGGQCQESSMSTKDSLKEFFTVYQRIFNLMGKALNMNPDVVTFTNSDCCLLPTMMGQATFVTHLTKAVEEAESVVVTKNNGRSNYPLLNRAYLLLSISILHAEDNMVIRCVEHITNLTQGDTHRHTHRLYVQSLLILHLLKRHGVHALPDLARVCVGNSLPTQSATNAEQLSACDKFYRVSASCEKKPATMHIYYFTIRLARIVWKAFESKQSSYYHDLQVLDKDTETFLKERSSESVICRCNFLVWNIRLRLLFGGDCPSLKHLPYTYLTGSPSDSSENKENITNQGSTEEKAESKQQETPLCSSSSANMIPLNGPVMFCELLRHSSTIRRYAQQVVMFNLQLKSLHPQEEMQFSAQITNEVKFAYSWDALDLVMEAQFLSAFILVYAGLYLEPRAHLKDFGQLARQYYLPHRMLQFLRLTLDLDFHSEAWDMCKLRREQINFVQHSNMDPQPLLISKTTTGDNNNSTPEDKEAGDFVLKTRTHPSNPKEDEENDDMGFTKDIQKSLQQLGGERSSSPSRAVKATFPDVELPEDIFSLLEGHDAAWYTASKRLLDEFLQQSPERLFSVLRAPSSTTTATAMALMHTPVTSVAASVAYPQVHTPPPDTDTPVTPTFLLAPPAAPRRKGNVTTITSADLTTPVFTSKKQLEEDEGMNRLRAIFKKPTKVDAATAALSAMRISDKPTPLQLRGKKHTDIVAPLAPRKCTRRTATASTSQLTPSAKSGADDEVEHCSETNGLFVSHKLLEKQKDRTRAQAKKIVDQVAVAPSSESGSSIVPATYDSAALFTAFERLSWLPRVPLCRTMCHLLALHYLSKGEQYLAAFYLTQALSQSFLLSYFFVMEHKARLASNPPIASSSQSSSSPSPAVMTAFQTISCLYTNLHNWLTSVRDLPPHWLLLQFTHVHLTPYTSLTSSNTSTAPHFLLVTKLKANSPPETRVMHKFTNSFSYVVNTFLEIMLENSQSMAETDRKVWWKRRFLLDEKLKDTLVEIRGLWFSEEDVQWMFAEQPHSDPVILLLDRELHRMPMEWILCPSREATVPPPNTGMLSNSGTTGNNSTRSTGVQSRVAPVAAAAASEDSGSTSSWSFYRGLNVAQCVHHLTVNAPRYVEGVNLHSGYYIVNPSGNLPSTESTLLPVFEQKFSWHGVAGQPPQPQEMLSALMTRDVFMYCGHGSGCKYASSTNLQSLNSRSMALLMGCSSGYMKVVGKFEPHGAVDIYICSGCPCILGLLWDVTDKDIDRYTQDFLSLWHERRDGGSAQQPLFGQLVRKARFACKLLNIVGKSVVVYGFPIEKKVTPQPDLHQL